MKKEKINTSKLKPDNFSIKYFLTNFIDDPMDAKDIVKIVVAIVGALLFLANTEYELVSNQTVSTAIQGLLSIGLSKKVLDFVHFYSSKWGIVPSKRNK